MSIKRIYANTYKKFDKKKIDKKLLRAYRFIRQFFHLFHSQYLLFRQIYNLRDELSLYKKNKLYNMILYVFKTILILIENKFSIEFRT